MEDTAMHPHHTHKKAYFLKPVAAAAILLAVALLLSWNASGELKLPAIFGDHMVVQANRAIPVWGWANPGERVRIAVNGKVWARTEANDQGRWQTELTACPKAGSKLEITVSGSKEQIVLRDVLAGEVWIGSGQSNMEWPVKLAMNGDQEVAAANWPEIRLFVVKKKVAEHPLKDCEGEWKVCAPDTVGDFSAVLYFFGRELHRQLHVPVGLIETAWGGTPAESWTSECTLQKTPLFQPILTRWAERMKRYPEDRAAYEQALKAWETEAEQAKAEGREAPRRPAEPWGPDHPWRPAGLYNGMITPIAPFAFRGVVWYQGESNADRAWQYRKLFPAMIRDWRDLWEQGDFPFYFVQLANFMEQKPEPGPSEWAELREAQAMTCSLRNTGMAVAIDIGDAKDIHPRNKQEVGRRLALIALARDYCRCLEYSGPVFKKAYVKHGSIEITFSHDGSGLATPNGAPLKGFAVAGRDGKFYWADAKIVGRRVVVSTPKVPDPVAVRYAWADNPECNLVNGAGLPAVPFRSDDWPGLTFGKH